jgi:hypothetical protein
MNKLLIIYLALLSFSALAAPLKTISTIPIAKSVNDIQPIQDAADADTVEDFDGVQVVSTDSTASKAEVVKDIAVTIPKEKADLPIQIAPLTTSSDTNKEVIPPQVSVPAVDPEAIKRILREHVPAFRYCYQKELDASQNESLKGRINLKFVIGQNGKVKKSEIVSEEISSDKVKGCIKNVLDGIQFPETSKTVSINQPMNLSAVRK